MQQMHRCLRIAAALILSLALYTTSWSKAVQPVVGFDIPAQTLESALLAFADQAGVQVSVATAAVSGIRSRGVYGHYTPSAALARLLAETGFQFNLIGDRTYSVAPAPTALSRSAAMTALDVFAAPLSQLSEESPVDGVRLPAAAPARAEAREASATVLGEVVVTGTHLRDHAPVGAQVLTLDRDDIEKLGLATVTEVLRTLPQNFRGGPGDETSRGREGGSNFGFGASGVNLRGLGAGSTLVLIDGRRLAAGGSEGTFTDVSTIPLSAVERIEVLTDGASAAYGSDAVGGVVNVILRRDYVGGDTQLRAGSVTDGGAHEYLLGQAVGWKIRDTSGVLSYEYYQRDALPAAQRELSASSDLTRFGGTNWGSNFSNPGTLFAGNDTYAIPAGQNGTTLTPADLVAGTTNVQNELEARDLLPELKRHSAFATLRHELTPSLALRLDGLFSRRSLEVSSGAAGLAAFLVVPSTNPFYVNPTGGTEPVLVQYNFIEDLGPLVAQYESDSHVVVLRADGALSGDWSWQAFATHSALDGRQDAFFVNSIAVDAALSDPDPATAFNPFGDGSFTNPATLATFRAPSFYVSDSKLREVGVSATGTVLALPAGEVRLALGGEYTRSAFAATNEIPAFSFRTDTDSDRTTRAAFGELLIPLLRTEDAAGVRRQLVELSLASRYERYSDFGESMTPRVAVNWSMTPAWTLRGAWSKSFKAPSLVDLDESNNVSLLRTRPDPQSPTGTSPVLFWIGRNADLSEERATILSAGIDFKSAASGAPQLGLTYFDIDFDGRIEFPPTGSYLVDPTLAALVTRDPTPAQRDQVCSRSTFEGNPDDCRNRPVAAIIDARMRNIAVSRVAGFDFLGSQVFGLPIGQLNLAINSTYLTRYERQDSTLLPTQTLLNQPGNPIDLRARGEVAWSHGGWRAATFLNYQDDYRDATTDRRIDSWTTADAHVSYTAPAHAGGWLSGTSIALSVQNLLDTEPPFFDNPVGFVGYDPENATHLGRFISLQVNKSW